MAKLYWRIKKNGKWTWTAVKEHSDHCDRNICEDCFCDQQELIQKLEEEE